MAESDPAARPPSDLAPAPDQPKSSRSSSASACSSRYSWPWYERSSSRAAIVPVRRWRGLLALIAVGRLCRPLEHLVQTAVQPDAPALRAVVDLDALSLGHAKFASSTGQFIALSRFRHPNACNDHLSSTSGSAPLARTLQRDDSLVSGDSRIAPPSVSTGSTSSGEDEGEERELAVGGVLHVHHQSRIEDAVRRWPVRLGNRAAVEHRLVRSLGS